eukprot:Em0023g172a
MAKAFTGSEIRNQSRKMRKAISVDTPISISGDEEISNPVLTNVRQFRPVKREGSQYEYDLQQLESSMVLRFPLYDIRNNSQTNLKTLLTHHSTEGEQVTSTADQGGRQVIAEVQYHGGEVQNGAQASAQNQDGVPIHAEIQSEEVCYLEPKNVIAEERKDLPPERECLDTFSVSHSPYSRRTARFQAQNEESSIGRNFEEAVKLDDSGDEDQCVITTPCASPNLDKRRTISLPGGITGIERGTEARALTEEQAILELYTPHSVQTLEEAILLYPALVNCSSMNNEAPIHTIVKMKRKDKLSLLVTLLTNSNADVNVETGSSGLSPLHQAVLEEDEMCVKTLLCFGANIKAQKGSYTHHCKCVATKSSLTYWRLLKQPL